MVGKVIRPVALLALMLAFPAVALGDAYDGHHCSHHDALPAEQQSRGHAGHAGPTGHAGAAREIDAGEPDEHGREHGEPCTCIGQCVTQVGVALPSPAPAVVALVVPATPTRVTATASQWAAIDPPYLHPYANAPPSLR